MFRDPHSSYVSININAISMEMGLILSQYDAPVSVQPGKEITGRTGVWVFL